MARSRRLEIISNVPEGVWAKIAEAFTGEHALCAWSFLLVMLLYVLFLLHVFGVVQIKPVDLNPVPRVETSH